jgi:hypothetical protein
MKSMKLSVAEQLSLATSLIGTALSVLSFFHSPTVVAKGLPQARSQNPLIYSQLKSISHRLDKLEAQPVQPRSQLSPVLVRRSQPALASASHQPIHQQSTSSISTSSISTSNISNLASEMPTVLKPEQQPRTSGSEAPSLHNVVSSKAVSNPSHSQVKPQTIHADVHHVQQGEKQGQQQSRPPIPPMQQLQQALALYAQRGDRISEIEMLNRMVAIYDRLGLHAQAEKLLQQEFDVAQ